MVGEVNRLAAELEAGVALTAAESATLAYEQGRALDALEAFSPLAEEKLSRAVKLNPNNSAAWDALAHCFWKKRDLAAAKACYEDSLRRSPRNVVALRALSQLARQTPRALPSALQESVDRAKAAVAADLADSASWAILGNAHLSHYFAGRRDALELQRATSAFARAAALEAAADGSAVAPSLLASGSGGAAPLCRRNPDLHYNRAQALSYQEDYPQALAAYRLAESIDPCLPCQPAIAALLSSVGRIAAAVAREGQPQLSAKKLRELLYIQEGLKRVEESATAAAAAPPPSARSVVAQRRAKATPSSSATAKPAASFDSSAVSRPAASATAGATTASPPTAGSGSGAPLSTEGPPADGPPSSEDNSSAAAGAPVVVDSSSAASEGSAPPSFRVCTIAQLGVGDNPGLHLFLKPLFVVPKDNAPPA